MTCCGGRDSVERMCDCFSIQTFAGLTKTPPVYRMALQCISAGVPWSVLLESSAARPRPPGLEHRLSYERNDRAWAFGQTKPTGMQNPGGEKKIMRSVTEVVECRMPWSRGAQMFEVTTTIPIPPVHGVLQKHVLLLGIDIYIYILGLSVLTCNSQ